MKCPKCRFENPKGSKFCLECGQKFELKCPNCNKDLPIDAKFCNECGHDLRKPEEALPKDLSFDEKLRKIQRYLPKGLTEKILSQRDRIEGERKQVTVMFADMEGFTQFSEKLGPEEAYTVMDQVYEILIHKVHDYEGTVNEFTGDGIMALFGAPIALEDAPQRAIRSAYAIHREMSRFSEKMKQEKEKIPPIKMRIGIHTGPVVVGTLGNDLRVEFKAVGDTVNLASRMEGLAVPGSTYVSEQTFKLTEGLFRYEALGEYAIKGKEEPVKAYRVIAPSTSRTRFDVSAERGLTPFVGRQRELELLLDGFERSKSGRGQAFSIMAEAGVGKSRLLYEFRKAVANEDVTFQEGKCLSYSRGVAYHPIIDIVKPNFDILEGDGDIEVREKLKRGLSILGADEASTLPYLLELLSVKDSGVELLSLSPEARKDRVIKAIIQISIKASEIRPLVIAIEDLHWIDKSSEEYLRDLLNSISGSRVFLIFTYRPEFVHTWGGRSYHNQVNLNRLSNRESLMMVSHLLDSSEIHKDLEDFILEKTEGVPFFIEEFIRSLKNLKIIERKDNQYLFAKDFLEMTIPATIQDVIMARVDMLPEDAKEVLQTGSVMKREFSYELIKHVTNLSEQEILSRLSILKDSELLYERGIYPGTTYIFKHALVQEVAYNSLLQKRRKEIHEKIGQATESLYPERLEEYYELLAHHYGRSDNKDKALEYLERANEKASKVSAMEEALVHFDEAMKLLDTLPDSEENRQRRISFLVKQFYVFRLLIRLPEYYDLLKRYEPITSGLDNQGLLGAFYFGLGLCEYVFGYLDQSVKTMTRGAELCEAAGNIEFASSAYVFLQWANLYRDAYDSVFGFKNDALRMLEQRFHPRWDVYSFCTASWAYSNLGRWNEALEEGQKALKAARGYSDDSLISFAALIVSMVHISRGDLDRGVEYGELATEKASTPQDKVWAQSFFAWALCRAGEPKRGTDLLAKLVPIYRAARSVPQEAFVTVWLCDGYWLAGEYEKAGQTLKEVIKLTERCGMKFYLGWAHRLLGEIALKTNPTQAKPHFEKSIEILQEIKAENELAMAFTGYGRLYKQQGNFAKAREYLTQALEIFERLDTLIEPDKVRKELAGLPDNAPVNE